ncbi:MAG: ABC transporter substrate-binding protein [Burkholderiaceae bacterium]
MNGVAPSAQAQTVAKTPARGGVLNVAVAPEPTQLTSANLTTMNVGMVSSKVLEGLVSYDLDLKPVPALARSWQITPDGKTLGFKLRPNVKWHDGKPFTYGARILPRRLYEGTDVLKNPANNAPMSAWGFGTPAVAEQAVANGPEHQAIVLEALQEIDAMLRSLPLEAARAFMLAVAGDKTHKEVATELGVTTRTVTNYIAQAMLACLRRLSLERPRPDAGHARIRHAHPRAAPHVVVGQHRAQRRGRHRPLNPRRAMVMVYNLYKIYEDCPYANHVSKRSQARMGWSHRGCPARTHRHPTPEAGRGRGHVCGRVRAPGSPERCRVPALLRPRGHYGSGCGHDGRGAARAAAQ